VPTVGTTEPLPLRAEASPKADDTRQASDVSIPAITQLVVASQPEGARVTVDGIGWGVTPVTIRHLRPGSKRIRVTHDGYAAAERVIEVHQDRASSVSVQLQALSPAVEPR
jgi:hypothetical protein